MNKIKKTSVKDEIAISTVKEIRETSLIFSLLIFNQANCTYNILILSEFSSSTSFEF